MSPVQAWVLWASCAHIAALSRLPPAVEHRLGYPQRVIVLDAIPQLNDISQDPSAAASSAISADIEAALEAAVNSVLASVGAAATTSGDSDTRRSAALTVAALAHSCLSLTSSGSLGHEEASVPDNSSEPPIVAGGNATSTTVDRLLSRLLGGISAPGTAVAETSQRTPLVEPAELIIGAGSLERLNCYAMSPSQQISLKAVSAALAAERLWRSSTGGEVPKGGPSVATVAGGGRSAAGASGVASSHGGGHSAGSSKEDHLPTEIYNLSIQAASAFLKGSDVPPEVLNAAWHHAQSPLQQPSSFASGADGGAAGSQLLRERGWLRSALLDMASCIWPSDLGERLAAQNQLKGGHLDLPSTAEALFRSCELSAARCLLSDDDGRGGQAEEEERLLASRAAMTASRQLPDLQCLIGISILKSELRRAAYRKTSPSRTLILELVSELLRPSKTQAHVSGLCTPTSPSSLLLGSPGGEQLAAILGSSMVPDLAAPMEQLQALLPLMEDKMVRLWLIQRVRPAFSDNPMRGWLICII